MISFILELVNFFLFLFQVFTVGESIVFDSILSGFMSIFTMYVINFYHRRLMKIKSVALSYDNDASNRGIYRAIAFIGYSIESITLFSLGSIIFFIFRCLLDFYFAITMLLYMNTVESNASHHGHSLITPTLWNGYVNAQYGMEWAIVAFILLITSSSGTSFILDDDDDGSFNSNNNGISNNHRLRMPIHILSSSKSVPRLIVKNSEKVVRNGHVSTEKSPLLGP